MNARRPQPSAHRGADTSTRSAATRRAARAYQAAFEAVLSIPIAGGLGYLADAYWDTAPWGLLLGLGFGFAAFVLRLLRMRQPGAKDGAREAPEAPDAKPARAAQDAREPGR